MLHTTEDTGTIFKDTGRFSAPSSCAAMGTKLCFQVQEDEENTPVCAT